MQIVIVDKDKCLPAKCEEGICVAKFSCTWKILEQIAPYKQPVIKLSRCLGCARCTFICPEGALKILESESNAKS